MTNTAPIILDSFPGSRIVAEDNPLNITGITIFDPDSSDTQTVVLSVSHGVLNLGTTTGLIVTNNGTGNVTLVGSATNINTALGTLGYNPNPNYNGDDTLTITVSDGIDNTDTHIPPATSPAIDATRNISLSITPVNDAPTLNPTNLNVAERGQVYFTPEQLGLIDPDIGTGQQVLAQQIVKITAIPTKGTLRLNGLILQVGSVFSYDQLASVQYIHNGSDVSPGDTDSFKVTVNDGGGGQSAETTVTVNLTPVNVVPTISGSGTVYEGYDAPVNVTANLGDIADLPAAATVTIVSTDLNGEGTLYLDNDNSGSFSTGDTDLSSGGTFTADKLGLLRFSHGGNETNPNDKPTFTIKVQDSGGGTGTPATSANTTVEIAVTPVNDDPILVNNRGASNPLAVAGASTTVLTTDDLQVTDVDSPVNQLVYTLQSRPTKGVIQLFAEGGWKNLGIGGFFTQAQLNAGLVRYVQEVGVTANTPDSFTFKVRDSAFTIGPNFSREGGVRDNPNDPDLAVKTFHINITTVNPSTVTVPSNPSPGYGGTTPGTGSPTIDTSVTYTNDNFTNIAVGDRTQEGGSGILTKDMLNFVFVNSNAVQVPAEQTVYTLLNLPNNGTLQQWNGSSWVNLSVGSTFTQADINKGVLTNTNPGAGDAGMIRFVHNGTEDFTSTFDYTVSVGGDVRINTQTDPNDAYKPFTLDIIPINDNPTITQAQPINLPEGGVTTIEPAKVKLDDPDNHPIDKPNNPLVLLPSEDFKANTNIATFKVNSLPANGTLFIDADGDGVIDTGETIIDTSTSINKNDLLEGRVKFAYNSSFTFIDSITVTPYDNNNNPLTNVDILFSPERYAFTNTLEFKFIDLPDHGTLFIDLNNNNQLDSGEEVNTGTYYSSSVLTGNQLKYLHNGTENFLDTFQVQGKDNHSATSGITTVNIDIYPVNDAPQVALTPNDTDPSVTLPGGATDKGENNPLTVNEGATGTITNSLLKAVDPDNSTTQRQFRITDNVDNGKLFLEKTPGVKRFLGLGSTFTQADIDAGYLKYEHNGLEVFTDRFYFQVSDGDKTTGVAYFDINVTPLNDKPILTTPASLDVTAANNAYVAIPIVSVADVDLASVATGETDFLRVELQVLNGSNNLVTGALLNYTAADPTSSLKFISGKGTNSLIVQGTKAEIDAVLASLQIAFTNDEDANDYKIRVTVDDRLYDSSGNLTSGANGGSANQDGTPIDATNNRVSRDILLSKVSNNNDVPTLTNTDYTVNEDGTTTLLGFNLTDADSFDQDVTAVVQLYSDAGTTTLANASTQARLQLGTTTGLTTATGNNTNTITLVGSLSEVNEALKSLKVNGVNDFNNGPLYLKTTFTDYTHAGVTNTVSVTNNINFVPINDAPVLTVPGSPFNLVGGATSINLPGVSFQDDKDVNQGATDFFTVTIVAPNAGDTLAATASGSATSVYDSGTKTLTITGNTADVNATLANLVYTPVNPNADITVNLVVTVNDGGNGDEGGTSTGNQTATGNVTVRISNNNEPPVNILPSPLTVLEDSSNNTVTGIQISDSDDFGANLTVVLTPTNGTLSFSGTTAGVTVTGSGTNADPYTLVGNKTNLNIHLSKLQFTPTANLHGAEGIASIRVTTTDTPLAGNGSAQTDTDDYRITITARNDRPTASNNVTLSSPSTEDAGTTQPSVVINSLDLDFGYSDATDNRTGITNSITGVSGGNTETPFSYVAIVGNAAIAAQGTWQISDGSGGWITIPATGLSTTNALIFPSDRQVRFVPEANFHGTPGSLSVRLADNSVTTLSVSNSATDFRNLTLSANGNLNASDNSSAWNDTDRAIATTVTNVNDRPTAANRILVAVDEDSTTHTGNTVSGIGFGYSDDADNQTSIPGGEDASTAFGGIAIVGNAATTAQGTWQYSNNGGATWNDIATPSDSNALILPTTARLRFLPASNFNGTPGNLTIRVADTVQTFSSSTDITGNLNLGQASNWSTPVTLSAPITKRNDAPAITATINNPTPTENNQTGTGNSVPAVNLLSGSSISDIDLSTTSGLDSSIFGAGTITVSLNSYFTGDILQVNSLPGIASITGGNGSNLVITLANTATIDQVNTILDSIQYRSSSDNPTNFGNNNTRTYTVVVNDGSNTQAGGNAGANGGLNSNTLTGTITINAVNDAPVLDANVNPVLSSTEDNPTPVGAVGSLISTFVGGISDVDSLTKGIAITNITNLGTLWYSKDNGSTWSSIASVSETNALLLASDANTRLYFQPNANLNGTLTTGITFRAWDQSQGTNGQFFNITSTGTGGISPFSSNTDTIAINISPVNDAPIASGSATLTAVNEDLPNPSGATVGSLFAGNFSDPTDNQIANGGSSPNTLAGVAIVGNAATSAQGKWQYYNGTMWVDVGTRDNTNALVVASNRNLRFLPATDYHGDVPALTVHLIDNSISVTTGTTVNLSGMGATGGTTAYSVGTVNLTTTVNPINDAPTASGSVSISNVNEDVTNPSGTVINTLITSSNYNDNKDDQTSNGGNNTATALTAIAVVGSTNYVAGQGTWQYSDGSGGWIDIPDNGLDDTKALVIPAGREIRFVPAGNFFGTPGTLTVRLADGTNALTASTSSSDYRNLGTVGGTSAWSSGTVAIATTVTNVNDRPTAANGILVAVDEDSTTHTGNTVSGIGFGYSDDADNQTSIPGGEDASTAFGGIAIVGNAATTAQGTWQYSNNGGATWNDIATPSDSNALILRTTARLRFLPASNFNGTPGNLTIRVADTPQTFSSGTNISSFLTQDGTWSESVTLSAPIDPQNDAPTVTATVLSPTVTENLTTGSGLSVDPVNLLSGSTVTDIDLTTTSGLNANTFGAGTITVTITDGIAGDTLRIAPGSTPAGVTTAGGTANNPLVITLDGDTTLTEVENILNNLQYLSSSDNPTNFGNDTQRNYTIVVNDGNNLQAGGNANAGGPNGLNSTTTLSGTITINPVNDPPVLDLDATDTGRETLDNSVTFIEMVGPDTGANAVYFAKGISLGGNQSGTNVVDVDSLNLSNFKVSIPTSGSGGVGAGDQLLLSTFSSGA